MQEKCFSCETMGANPRLRSFSKKIPQREKKFLTTFGKVVYSQRLLNKKFCILNYGLSGIKELELKIGEKVKALRLGSDLTQAELADRARLTKGFISQLENDQTSTSVDSLADILEALGVTLSEFFSDNTETKVVFAPSERVEIEGKGVDRFELLVPGSTNNLMDPIMIELKPGERMEPQGPHPGEQFGYVLNGTVTLKFDKKLFKVPSRHCFYFESDRSHQMVNNGTTAAKLLWITTPPQM